MPTTALPNSTPWEAPFRTKPDLSHFQILESCAHILIPMETHPSKLGTHVLDGFFLGLSHKSEGWRFWVPLKGKIVEAWNVQIFEGDFNFKEDKANELEVRKWEISLEGQDTSIMSCQHNGPPFITDNSSSLIFPSRPPPVTVPTPAP